jgi:uridine kinase
MTVKSEEAKPSVCRAKLVAIIGGSGAGKSYLAGLLQEKLGAKATRLALDDFYLDRSACSPGRRARINFDHPRALDWAELENVLTQLASGKAASAPQYDFTTHTRRPVRRLVEPSPVVLVEGLWPCHRRSIRALFDLRIFLDCPEDMRLSRRLQRDVPQRGRSPESVRQQFFQTVAPMHHKFVRPQRQWSDLVMRKPAAAREVARLAKKIEQLN